jgi:hypothetical protein
MKVSRTQEETELSDLTARIIKNIESIPYSGKLYSKIKNDILSTFVGLRIDKFVNSLTTKPLIVVQNENFNKVLKDLEERYIQKDYNESHLTSVLKSLVPSLDSIIRSDAYRQGVISFLRLLDLIKNYIPISIDELSEFDYMKRSINLSNLITEKYRNLISILLTIAKNYEKSITSTIKRKDIPKKVRDEMGFSFMSNYTTKEIIDEVELLSLHDLCYSFSEYCTFSESRDLIKSFYRFPNLKIDIKNIQGYITTNNIWKLDLVEPHFQIITKGIESLPKRKIDLIRFVRTHFTSDNSLDMKFIDSKQYNYFDDYYEYHLENELQNIFDEWSNKAYISEWEKFWITIEGKCFKNSIISKDRIIIRQADIIDELIEENNQDNNEFIPQFADMQNLAPNDIYINIDYREHSQGNELTIKIRDISISGGFGLLDLYSKKGKKGKTTKNFKYLQCLLDPNKFREYERSDKGSEELLTSRTREFNNLFRRKFPIGKQRVVKKLHNQNPMCLFHLELIEPKYKPNTTI